MDDVDVSLQRLLAIAACARSRRPIQVSSTSGDGSASSSMARPRRRRPAIAIRRATATRCSRMGRIPRIRSSSRSARTAARARRVMPRRPAGRSRPRACRRGSPRPPPIRFSLGRWCERADRRYEQSAAAYSMLLHRAVFRIGLPVPSGAEFTLAAVDDPYHYASAAELSLFRRPLPATNLRFLSSTMWDGREPSLAQQAIDATLGHAQATTHRSGADRRDRRIRDARYRPRRASTMAPANSMSRARRGGPIVLAAATFNPRRRGSQRIRRSTPTGPATRAAHSIARGQRLFETRADQDRRRRRPRRSTRHVLDLSRHVERRRSLGRARCSTSGSRPPASHAGPAALHVAREPPTAPRSRRRIRGSRYDRQVDGHREVQGPGAARARDARAVLPRWLRPGSRRRSSQFYVTAVPPAAVAARDRGTSSRSCSRSSRRLGGTALMYAL